MRSDYDAEFPVDPHNEHLASEHYAMFQLADAFQLSPDEQTTLWTMVIGAAALDLIHAQQLRVVQEIETLERWWELPGEPGEVG